MEYDSKFERYVFAAAMLVTAAIIVFNVVDLPYNEQPVISSTVETTTNQESEKAVQAMKQIATRININTATIDELQTIDGIGYNLAYQIIAYRNALGEYTSLEQLMNIRGIGQRVFEKIEPYITL